MTIIYVHGVKVRSEQHGIALEKPFQRWLGPRLAVNGAAVGYEPVFWGDLAARFRWNLASRPPTALLRMGGAEDFAALGALREAAAATPLDTVHAQPALPGPVLGQPVVAAGPAVPPLAALPRERRADFLVDLYLLCRSAGTTKDLVAEDPTVTPIADAAAAVAEQWDTIAAQEVADAARAQRLIAAVLAKLDGDALIPMGGFADWMTKAGEVLRRATIWPADAVGTIFAETRPILNELVAYFVGDVFTYLVDRGDAASPGEIPRRLLAALRRAQERKKATGEKIVIVSHSMGGQLVYDALACFADSDPTLHGLAVDHWITCGAQVSLFAEMRLLLGQPEGPPPARLACPARIKAWTNYYDRNDLVGFVMEPVFLGVTDQEYDTGYGLALAHTGFLGRPSFFQAIAERV